MKKLVISIVLVMVVALLYSTYDSRSRFDQTLSDDQLVNVDVSPLTEALTFARSSANGRADLLLVKSVVNGRYEAISLSAYYQREVTDPIALFAEQGYEDITRAWDADNEVKGDVTELGIPVDLAGRHIAAGTNYSSHAEELLLDDPPFLFPKTVSPTSWNASVTATSAFLDYEVELCVLPLKPPAAESDNDRPTNWGMLLCNDFTDRWALLRGLDLQRPMGRTGFVDAKGQSGFLPVGYLFVIPRDFTSYYQKIQISLYLNDQLQQQALGSWMILTPEQIVEEAATLQSAAFERASGEIVKLPVPDHGSGVLVLTGPPGGVRFKPHNIWNPWFYLQAGDQVTSHASHLGTLQNTINQP